MTTILLENPSADQEEWKFVVPLDQLELQGPVKESGRIRGKTISFTATAITLEIGELSNNRILQEDDPSKFITLSFKGLRFPNGSRRVTGEYIQRLMEAGLYLNGTQYRFYHHSNRQLKERSCFMRAADSDAELDRRIYSLGEFEKIDNITKRAERIGLLFTEASLDFTLDPQKTLDIPDITFGDELFSNGCGLMARKLAVQVAKKMGIKFRNVRYTPRVFQIRYLGYKGVLMLHPELDQEKKHLVHFRESMKKFNTTTTNAFCVVGYSTPYTFGRLNNDIVTLLSSLGVTNEKLLTKQEEYFTWIEEATTNHLRAVDFLACLGKYKEVEQILLDGLDDPKVLRMVRDAQKSEIAKFQREGKRKTRMVIHKSRFLFGVCDPYGVLKEGQVHIRITTEKGVSTPIDADVLVVRNPCLHPGDCWKLRATYHPKLAHLIDCVVFAAVARSGHASTPPMFSSGDLDGDRYFVCWDPDIVPPIAVQSHSHPQNKERVEKDITRKDLATHFAMYKYDNTGLSQIAALRQKWARCKPEGALSGECQELIALRSQAIDGAEVVIPDRLFDLPKMDEPFIVDLLVNAAMKFSERFLETLSVYDVARGLSRDDAIQSIRQLLRGERHAFSEFEMFNVAVAIARRRGIDLRLILSYLDFGALTVEQKYTVSSTLGLTPEEDRYIWNSLFRSDILTDQDLEQRKLNTKVPLQRFYSSNNNGFPRFWQYLKICLRDFTRKMLIVKVDDRFGFGIFIRGKVPWDEDAPVNDNLQIVVCSFLPTSSGPMSTYRPCSTDYRLHVADNILQLFDKQRSDSFVFMTRSGADVIVSIALQKISASVQRQCGRVHRSPVTTIELHVIPNRDQTSHDLFDLCFEHVPTKAHISRPGRQKVPYLLNRLEDVDWSKEGRTWMKELFIPKASQEKIQTVLQDRDIADVEKVLALCLDNHAYDELLLTFYTTITPIQRMNVGVTKKWIERHPPLVYCLLKAQPPTMDRFVSPHLADLELTIIQNVIRSANQTGIASLVALEKIAASVARVSMDEYLHLLTSASLSVRSFELVREVLFILHESRMDVMSRSPVVEYAHKRALGIAFDRVEEAADECPCDDHGRPRKAGGRGPAPATVRLVPVQNESTQVIAHVRIDEPTAVRTYSHVRLQAVSNPDSEEGWVDGKPVVDAIVVSVKKGEMKMELQYPLPPEFAQMQWRMYNAGSVATTRAMMDAVGRLVRDGPTCCSFSNLIVAKHEGGTDGQTDEDSDASTDVADDLDEDELNPNQVRAVESSENPLALIWGPPGTGKTTVVVEILRRFLETLDKKEKILMTASTHDAVDDALELFVELNAEEEVVPNDKILRVATDSLKVNEALRDYTIDARVGGDVNENKRLVKEAEDRVKSARIVFTSCAGAGLGILRKVDFEIAIIDEASQITETCALIPLVKGCRKAVLIGDHAQLRPMVRNMGKVLLQDVSMLERLYTGPNVQGMSKTMLNVQYRFPKQLAVFPSEEFYRGRLRTGMTGAPTPLAVLKDSKFPWPTEHGVVVPVVFVQCGSEEDMGRMSKSNVGQAEVVQEVIKLLTTENTPEGKPESDPRRKGKAADRGPDTQGSEQKEGKPNITILTPYTKQVSELKSRVPNDVGVFTIDSFQGRESDIIIFSTVRCNVESDIGFLEDKKRLNVVWTRAKLALIVVGDRATLVEKSGLWKRALDSCVPVIFPEDSGATQT